MPRKWGDLDLRRLSLDQLDQLVQDVLQERTSRALDLEDPQALANLALQKGFSISGDPIQPQDMGNGIIAITGVVRDVSRVKHRCHLYSIRIGDELTFTEHWVWDEYCPTFIHSETAKVDSIRRTVSLHAPADGTILVQHSMTHDGERHERMGAKALRVVHHPDEKTGEILKTTFESVPASVIKRLPPPPSNDD